MPLKRRVMSISQTSLQTSEACACVTGCTTMVRHIRSFSGPSKLFWYTYRLDIYIVYTLYIHCIYICVRTPTLHECSLALAALRAAALARSLLRDKAMFKAWKDLAAKCALKAKGDVHFPDFPSDFRNLRLRDRMY